MRLRIVRIGWVGSDSLKVRGMVLGIHLGGADDGRKV
jgi:hypothetical protein